MQFDSKIYAIYAREILDSRGYPTLETTVVLNSGFRGVAGVPSGTSVGKYEALEKRDSDNKHYQGMGVLAAINNVNNIISPALKGMDSFNQNEIDKKLIDLDHTQNKSNLGANAILSTSIANAIAASNCQRISLYRYLNTLINPLFPTVIKKIPTPIIEMINGGKHGAGNLEFQEFHIVPASNRTLAQGLESCVDIYQTLRDLLIHRNAVRSVGFEGGYAPNLFTNSEAVDLIIEAIKEAGFKQGFDIFMALDLAATNFKTDKGYTIKDRPAALSGVDFVKFLVELQKKYHFLLLEDALAEDDWDNWTTLTREIGQDTLIIGDDLIATNPERLKMAIEKKACNAVLLKPNQIGSLTELINVTVIAKKEGFKTIISHRSGETTDSYIADLAVAVQSDFVKFGAPARGERVAKYNRLLQIESELKLK